MQGVFDNILGEIEPYIEEVATRTPILFVYGGLIRAIVLFASDSR